MAQSHADSHDLDKLSRWSQALADGWGGDFPVCAAFLVRPEDRCAHNLFREFRSSFQNAGAEFEHLVIFGQHGVSRTALELLDLLGLPRESLPLLVLFTGPAAKGFYWARLDAGASDEDSVRTSKEPDGGSDAPWKMLLRKMPLARIESGSGSTASELHLDSVPGLAVTLLDSGLIKDVVRAALSRASSPGLT